MAANNTNQLVTTYDNSQWQRPHVINYADDPLLPAFVVSVQRGAGSKDATGAATSTTERHIFTLTQHVIKTGASFSHSYVTRWPKDFPEDSEYQHRKSPRLIPNTYIDPQADAVILASDDDSQMEGVIDAYSQHSQIGRILTAFVESTNSTPGAEKGHPLLVVRRDGFIQTAGIFGEMQKAWGWYLRRELKGHKIDAAVERVNALSFNKVGGHVHWFNHGGISFSEFQRVILDPYREVVTKREALQAAQDALEAKQQENRGEITGDVGEWYTSEFARRVKRLAQTKSGRHGALFNFAVWIASINMTEWAPDLHLGLPTEVLQATRDNDYFAEYAHSKQEVERTWNDGLKSSRVKVLRKPVALCEVKEDDLPAWAQAATVTAPQADPDDDLDLFLMAAYATRRNGLVSDNQAQKKTAVSNWQPPTSKPTRTAVDADTLAKELWGTDAIDFAPGTGEFPKRTAHTCNSQDNSHGSIITIRMNETLASPMITPKWRETEKRPACNACYHERVVRHSKQILFELNRVGRLVHFTLQNETEYKQFVTRSRKRKERDTSTEAAYRASPQDEKTYVIVYEFELNPLGTAVPGDKGELYQLVKQWLHTPENKRVSSSLGWGGTYQGDKGDGRVKYAEQQGVEVQPAVQLWTSSTVAGVAAALDVKLAFMQKEFKVSIDAMSAWNMLESAKIELRERKTNQMGFEAFMMFLADNDPNFAALEEDVTHKGQVTNYPMYAMRDMPPEEAHILPYEEVEPAPQYAPIGDLSLGISIGGLHYAT